MCPRLVWAKIRPGDLIWNLMDGGEELWLDEEAGANPMRREVATTVGALHPCLCLALVDLVLMVLAPNGKFGWTYRHGWERAGLEKQEYESMTQRDDA